LEKLRVLVTIKTYPIPSSKYDELVCTAGVTEAGDFVRLYPINFRELDYAKRYKKYQWMELLAERHKGRDVRKESYRPDTKSIRMIGEPISPESGTWCERSRYVLAKRAQSMEQLQDQKKLDRTSLGIFKPRKICELLVIPDSPTWNPGFLANLRQQRLWDDRSATKEPPRKIPWKFKYRFECDDNRCNRNHCMMIEDWEVGALYWRSIESGDTPEEAAESVRKKFFDQICAPDKDTHFFVGTVLKHGTWVIVGTFWPKLSPQSKLF